MCNVWKKEEKVIYLHVMYSEFTPTCTLKAESFGHLISTEKKNGC